MGYREWIKRLEGRGDLLRDRDPISKHLQICGELKNLEPTAALFDRVQESEFRVAGNLFPSKAAFADYFNIPVSEIIPFLSRAI